MSHFEDGANVGSESLRQPASPIYSSLASFSSLLLSNSPTSYFSRRLAFYLGRGGTPHSIRKSRHPSYLENDSHLPRSRKNSLIGSRSRKTSSVSINSFIDCEDGRYFDFESSIVLSGGGEKQTFAASSRKGSIVWKGSYRKKSLCEPTRKLSVSSPSSRKSSAIDIRPLTRKETVYYDSSALIDFANKAPSRKVSVNSTRPDAFSGTTTCKVSKAKTSLHHHHRQHKAQKVSVPASSVGEQKQRARLRLLSSGMEYAFGVFKKIQYFYNEINPATLTGAIDVIVVEQPDGTYQSTPFHVRFGKYGVLHSREKVIDITINGQEIATKMKLGENGEAFFVEETEETDDFPDHLATSPLPHQSIDTDKVIMEGIRTLKKQQRDETRSRAEQKRNQHRSASRSASRSRSPTTGRRRNGNPKAPIDQHQQHNTAEYMVTQQQLLAPAPLARVRRVRSMPNLEDPDCGAGRRMQHSVSTVEKVIPQSSSFPKAPQDSDSEDSQTVEASDAYGTLRDSSAVMDGAVSDSEVDRCQLQLPTVGVDVKDWKWGELPDVDKTPTEEKPTNSSKQAETSSSGWTWFGWTRSSKRKDDQGIYLEDLEKSLEVDPTVTARYLGRHATNAKPSPPQLLVEDEQTPTGDTPSMSSSPHQVPEDPIHELSDAESPQQDHGYGSNPGSVFGEGSTGRSSSPWPYDVQSCLEDCAFSLCGANGAVDITTITEEQFNERRVSFEQFCSDPLLTAERQDLIMRINGRYYPRSVADAMLMSLIYFQKPLSEEKVNKLMDEYKQKTSSTTKSAHSSGGSWFSWSRKGSAADTDIKDDPAVIVPIPSSLSDQKVTHETPTRPKTEPVNILRPSPSKSTTPPMMSVAVDMEGKASEKDASGQNPQRQRFVRSLRLPSDGLKALGLRKGVNEVRFSVTTKFQGTSWCMCHIYLWDWCDKIVISDIDGTITKSDVLGHIMPVIGGTWAHNGVAELYTGIKNNGYKMVYLSSRAIGQSSYTKHYLRNVVQDSNKMLPDGPMLLSPTSLLSAFRKEVIERKPYEFKIAALMDLKNLFPVKQPFYAGFGNRETDVRSYKAVNIVPERILTIDPNGVVRRADSIGYVSSYKGMAVDVVDYLFPPVIKNRIEAKEENQAVVQFTKPQVYSSFTHWRNPPIAQTPIADADLKEYEARRQRGANRAKK